MNMTLWAAATTNYKDKMIYLGEFYPYEVLASKHMAFDSQIQTLHSGCMLEIRLTISFI